MTNDVCIRTKLKSLELVRTKLLVEFSENGRKKKNIVKRSDGTYSMLIKVLSFYDKKEKILK
jgi:hypothetical protein